METAYGALSLSLACLDSVPHRPAPGWPREPGTQNAEPIGARPHPRRRRRHDARGSAVSARQFHDAVHGDAAKLTIHQVRTQYRPLRSPSIPGGRGEGHGRRLSEPPMDPSPATGTDALSAALPSISGNPLRARSGMAFLLLIVTKNCQNGVWPSPITWGGCHEGSPESRHVETVVDHEGSPLGEIPFPSADVTRRSGEHPNTKLDPRSTGRQTLGQCICHSLPPLGRQCCNSVE
jgi:hypothetical protein